MCLPNQFTYKIELLYVYSIKTKAQKGWQMNSKPDY